MAKIEHSIDIAVPVREAYDQWTQFEEFPRFMEGVESVRQLDDTHLHWVAEIAGKRQEWDAEITEQTPDQRIAWTSTTGDRNAGSVDFHRLGEERTRVTLTMDVEPSGVVEQIGTALGVASGSVKGDLERFKEFIESRGSATGAWRGEVEQNDVTGSGARDDERELAGAGSMGSYGSTSTSGYDTDPATTGASTTDPYGTAGSSTFPDTTRVERDRDV
jgi:carbon monoxide dehydrogenase subunit G